MHSDPEQPSAQTRGHATVARMAPLLNIQLFQAEILPQHDPYIPSSLSLSDMTEDELADDEEDNQDDDSSTYGSDYSDYPAPHPKFIMTAPSVIHAIKTYNPYEDPCFDPSKFRTHTITCLDTIPFVNGKFDGRGRYIGNSEYTTQLLPSLEYSEEFTPVPFSGKFPTTYIASAHLFTIATTKELKKYQHHVCDTDGVPRSQQLTHFPPNIYFARQFSYELHVYRSNTDYQELVPQLHELHHLLCELKQAVHAVLLPQQAVKCWNDTLTAYLVHGNTITQAILPWGKYFQQVAPSSNLLLTVEEAGALRMAAGIFYFYGQTDLAILLDEILQTPLPDEDFITTELTYGYLDNRSGIPKSNSTIPSMDNLWCRIANHMRNKQCRYYERYSRPHIIPQPAIPSGLHAIRAT